MVLSRAPAVGWRFLLDAAQAQPVPTTRRRRRQAPISPTWSDDGCVQNEVIVFANQTTVVSGNAPRNHREVTYTRYRYDYCEDTDLGTDLGTSSQPMFSGDLNRASLECRHPRAYRLRFRSVTVRLVLVWNGRAA